MYSYSLLSLIPFLETRMIFNWFLIPGFFLSVFSFKKPFYKAFLFFHQHTIRKMFREGEFYLENRVALFRFRQEKPGKKCGNTSCNYVDMEEFWRVIPTTIKMAVNNRLILTLKK